MESEIKNHLETLVKAISALSPSRNLISQLILMLPKDYLTVYDSYSEFIKDAKVETVMKQMGVSLGDAIKRDENSLSASLYKFIHESFYWSASEETRESLAKLLNVPMDSIYNPYEEWLELVLRKMQNIPKEAKILRLLDIILKTKFLDELATSEARTSEYYDAIKNFYNDKAKELSELYIDPSELRRLISFLTENSEQTHYKRESYASGTTYEYAYLLHGKYHLDILDKRTSRSLQYYSGREQQWITYYIKRKELVERVLRRISGGEK